MAKLINLITFLLFIVIWPNNNSLVITRFDDEEEDCTLPTGLKEEIQGYQETVNKIVNSIVYGEFAGDTYKSLEKMTDKFGSRLSGSESLENSIDYMIDEFKKAGLENVHTEDALVPHWVRGYENAELVHPRKAKIQILGLGTSIGTPRGGIIGDVIVVESFDELSKIPDSEIQGKIVVYAQPWNGYGPTVAYRGRGASAASKKGAIASLIRSATPFSIGSPHTGMQRYATDVKPIPTACITIEDAEMLLRLYRSGEKLQIRIEMEDRNLPDKMSRNVIGELLGAHVKNESVVVVSGHLDSWDVGVGAMDDGGGAFISWKAIEYLKKLNLIPKRTIRSILWTGEEFGYVGARAYQKNHSKTEEKEFNFFFESDMGTFEPLGLDFSGNKNAECIFKEILKLMTPLNATKFDSPTDGGPDISLWVDKGFPGASLLNKNEKYFWYHHSAGDSMLIEDSKSLDKCTALFAAASYVIANLSVDIPKDKYSVVQGSVQGYEFAEMISPRKYQLQLLGLGTSIGTPKGGITADIVVVESFEELSQLPNETVNGKIVIFVPIWKGYGETGQYRSQGASAASKKGAIASLIRSITPFSIGSPHTGVQYYENDVKPIPTACITVEDAKMLLRLYRNGENVQIHLEMEDENKSPIMSRNTIGELIGSVHKNESVVIVSGHLDSWDIGVGAMDDGGGCFISWKAVEYLKKLKLRPKRTIRSILWTGEEFGIWGGKAYKEAHAANEKIEFNFLMESDIGTFKPLGLDFAGNKQAHCIFREIMKLMSPLNATVYGTEASLPDLGAWINQGFPGASLKNANEKYFWFHHSAGDSMLVEDIIHLDKGTALFAAAAYIIADLSIDIPKTVKDFIPEEHNFNHIC